MISECEKAQLKMSQIKTGETITPNKKQNPTNAGGAQSFTQGQERRSFLQARKKLENLQNSQPVYPALNSFGGFHAAPMRHAKTFQGSHALKKLKHPKKSQITSRPLILRSEQKQIQHIHNDLRDHRFLERIRKPWKHVQYTEELVNLEQETHGKENILDQHHQNIRQDTPFASWAQRERNSIRKDNIRVQNSKSEIKGETFIKAGIQSEKSTHSRRHELRLSALMSITNLKPSMSLLTSQNGVQV